MPFSVYVLRSLRNGQRYTGFTSRDVQVRLAEHNRGFPKGWSSRNGPFVLLHQEQFQTEEEARARERFFKTGRGRAILDEMLAGYPPSAGEAL